MYTNVWRVINSNGDGDDNGRKRSVTLTSRLDKTLYALLQVESRARGISLNSLINSIVRRYISWEKYAEEIGFIPLARETVRLIFEELEERKMRQIAYRIGKTLPKELILRTYLA